MGVLILIIIVLAFVGFIFINVKINNLKYRARQQVLKNTGMSSSDINAGITASFEKKYLQKFLEDYPNYTEETIKNLLKEYAIKILNRNNTNEFSNKVCEKMQKDSKLEKMQSMEFRRVNINSYNKGTLNAIVVFTDNRDEYNMWLTCSVVEKNIRLETYNILKGAVIGF